ncbi:hypothetical protein B0H19DRAFT_1372342 [Mycena capillaripes]|nr:hypothetical protein B0H19DRAFT_1372342 [Mycena capillaripes]
MAPGCLLPSSPLASPTRATDELLKLTQQMMPSKPLEVFIGWMSPFCTMGLTKLFCGQCLLKIQASIIRGQGQGQAAAAKTAEKMYKNNGRLATVNFYCLVTTTIDEDDDDFFGSAPAVGSPVRPIRPPMHIDASPSGRDELSQ